MTGLALLVVLVGFGVFTGVAAGLLGVGGGIMMVPFLVLVAGISQHQAEATSLLVVLPTSIVASIVLRRRGVGDLGTAIRFGIVGSIGGAGGALLALTLPAVTLRYIFAAFLALIGARLLRDAVVGGR
jgi:uncharacterized membrane protein YfcA